MSISNFRTKKKNREKIAMVTCYDYTSARLLADTNVDCILVGDSLAMTMHGESSTLPATMTLMALHTRAVVRGAPKKFVVADMPFLSYRKDLSENVEAAGELMRAGAHAIKLEGARGNEELIRHFVDSGIPVMGHLGLTPQSVNQIGGYKVQGRDDGQAEQILAESIALQQAGCFALVLECVPSSLSRLITGELNIPTIGIGAGPDTDGQVLVWQDMLGLNTDFKPTFVRRYLNGCELIQDSINQYVLDVQTGSFPSLKESFK